MTFAPCSLATTPQPPDAAESASETESDSESETGDEQEEKGVDDGAAVTPI
jgi:hypothetical protein